jgi:hypothetical protein
MTTHSACAQGSSPITVRPVNDLPFQVTVKDRTQGKKRIQDFGVVCTSLIKVAPNLKQPDLFSYKADVIRIVVDGYAMLYDEAGHKIPVKAGDMISIPANSNYRVDTGPKGLIMVSIGPHPNNKTYKP